MTYYIARGTLLSVMWQPGREGNLGENYTCMYMYVWLSPFAVHMKLSQRCFSAILQYKIKSFKTKLVSGGHHAIRI